jgi:hypothetical protein
MARETEAVMAAFQDRRSVAERQQGNGERQSQPC